MKNDILISADNLGEILEIPLDKTPNAEFDINLQNKEYKFEIRTLADDKTYITILSDDITLCNMANLKTGVDLLFFSPIENAVIFFSPTSDIIKDGYNYADFGDSIKLYYAELL